MRGTSAGNIRYVKSNTHETVDKKSQALPPNSAIGFLSRTVDGSRQMSSRWLNGHLTTLEVDGVISSTTRDALEAGPRLLAVSDVSGATNWFQVITNPNNDQLIAETIRIPNIVDFLDRLSEGV